MALPNAVASAVVRRLSTQTESRTPSPEALASAVARRLSFNRQVASAVALRLSTNRQAASAIAQRLSTNRRMASAVARRLQLPGLASAIAHRLGEGAEGEGGDLPVQAETAPPKGGDKI